jgi:hypothetical protein
MAARVAAIAAGVAIVLWLMLDSRVVQPERAAPATSAALVVLALIFGGGAWATAVGGQRERTPLLAGMAAGVGGYALARLVMF